MDAPGQNPMAPAAGRVRERHPSIRVTAQLIGTGLDTGIVKHVGEVPSSGRNFKH